MLSVNETRISGNLTRDPEVRFLSNEKVVAKFSIANNRRFKGQDGEWKEVTTFVDIEAWGRMAETVGQYLTKGSGVYVSGRLNVQSWEDDKGAKHSKLIIIADEVQFLDRRPADGEQRQGERSEPRREAEVVSRQSSAAQVATAGSAPAPRSAPANRAAPTPENLDEPPF